MTDPTTPEARLDRIERTLTNLAEVVGRLVDILAEDSRGLDRTFGARPDVFARRGSDAEG